MYITHIIFADVAIRLLEQIQRGGFQTGAVGAAFLTVDIINAS